jgi:hypothetical protein
VSARRNFGHPLPICPQTKGRIATTIRPFICGSLPHQAPVQRIATQEIYVLYPGLAARCTSTCSFRNSDTGSRAMCAMRNSTKGRGLVQSSLRVADSAQVAPEVMVGVASRDEHPVSRYEGQGCARPYEREPAVNADKPFRGAGGPPVAGTGPIGAVQQSMLYCHAVVSVRCFSRCSNRPAHASGPRPLPVAIYHSYSPAAINVVARRAQCG